MSEWWTYSLSDFLLFSPRTYYRLFELYNAAIWPEQIAAVGLGIVLLALLLAAARTRWELLVIPLIWCAISGATLWTMEAPDAWVMPAAAALALLLAGYKILLHRRRAVLASGARAT